VKFRSFEGLRGVLSLLVCSGHYGINNLLEPYGIHLRFELAVDVFFALSGYVLCHTGYFGRKSLGEFVISRWARLYPLQFLTLAAMALLYAVSGRALNIWVVIQGAALAYGLGIPPTLLSLNFPSWSVSVEFWLSIAMFLFLSGRLSPRLAAVPIVTALVILLYPGFQLLTVEPMHLHLSGGLLRGIAGFLVGVAAYVYCNLSAAGRPPYWTAGASLSALALLFLKPELTHFDSWLLYLVMFTTLVCLQAWDSRLFLSHRGFVFLGSISYSVYLLHIPVVRWMEYIFSATALRGWHKLPVLAVLLPLATVMFRRVEKPLQTATLDWWRRVHPGAPDSSRKPTGPLECSPKGRQSRLWFIHERRQGGVTQLPEE
jgi:peptidoglycan/LPS O-acetylase OafA/YrhL